MNAITRNAFRACGIEDPAVQRDAVRFARSLIGNRWSWPHDNDGKRQEINFAWVERTLKSDEAELRLKAGDTPLHQKSHAQKATEVVGAANVQYMASQGWELDASCGRIQWSKRTRNGAACFVVHRPKEPLCPWDLRAAGLYSNGFAALSTLIDSANRLVEHELFGGWQEGDTK